MLLRFSTVAGEAGSADTQRDPRGFAVTFDTEEGNYDLVGNNTPIYGSHAFMWVNAAGERFWVNYHVKTDHGNEFFMQDEGDAMNGQDSEFHLRDLRQAIDNGDHPSWLLKVYVMPIDEAWD